MRRERPLHRLLLHRTWGPALAGPTIVLVLIALTAMLSAQTTPDVLFRAAMETETVKGDLRSAIEQYRKVAVGSDRALAAQALLRMAECYQKLGDAEARAVYQRVVSSFSDQPQAVALARTRLANDGRTASARGDRVVWSGPGVDLFGTVSPDGRYLTYTDWGATTNLMLHDFVTGHDRALTNNITYGQFGYAQYSAISRTGGDVAYEWDNNATNQTELRIAGLRGTGVPASRLVLSLPIGDSIQPVDWSPDGRSITVLVERTDRSSQIGLVSVQDGTLRVLKSVGWRGAGKVFFSPDGRYVAYDLFDEATRKADVLVMAVDASRETTVVSDTNGNEVMGWAADGHVLFSSTRSGTAGLWGVRVVEGQAAASPVLLRSDLKSSWSLGLTPSGTLYVWKASGAPYVRVAPIDLESGAVGSESLFEQFIESRGRPNWSGDGKHLLFISCGPGGGGPCAITVWSSDAGTVKDVPHSLGYVVYPSLSPDGRQIVTQGTDRTGRRGIYLIETSTGKTTFLQGMGNPSWAPDGRGIYRPGPNGRILHRDLASGDERPAFTPSTPGSRACSFSPSLELVACIKTDAATQVSSLIVDQVAGGSVRTVLSLPASREINARYQWTPDGRALLARTFVAGAPDSDELWLAPLEGQPRKANVDMRRWEEGGHLALSPDGRHAAYVANAGEVGAEVWALENILPVRK